MLRGARTAVYKGELGLMQSQRDELLWLGCALNKNREDMFIIPSRLGEKVEWEKFKTWAKARKVRILAYIMFLKQELR